MRLWKKVCLSRIHSQIDRITSVMHIIACCSKVSSSFSWRKSRYIVMHFYEKQFPFESVNTKNNGRINGNKIIEVCSQYLLNFKTKRHIFEKHLKLIILLWKWKNCFKIYSPNIVTMKIAKVLCLWIPD